MLSRATPSTEQVQYLAFEPRFVPNTAIADPVKSNSGTDARFQKYNGYLTCEIECEFRGTSCSMLCAEIGHPKRPYCVPTPYIGKPRCSDIVNFRTSIVNDNPSGRPVHEENDYRGSKLSVVNLIATTWHHQDCVNAHQSNRIHLSTIS